MHGYKGFNPDMTCRGFQYKAGKTYAMEDGIALCGRGFHFCKEMADVFEYYGGADCRYAEVEALGEVVDGIGKSVTDRIRIVREITRAQALELMYAQSGVDFTAAPFPADDIIRARENGTLGGMLPSWTEFPVQFANGERNVLVVGRDECHTYLITKYLMAEPFQMNETWTNEGGWPACAMRRHVQELFEQLPEEIRKIAIPVTVRQKAGREAASCKDRAFLLSAPQVFGDSLPDRIRELDSPDRQIDIFRGPANRVKRRPGASVASWWWLRSAYDDLPYSFGNVDSDGSSHFDYAYASWAGGVVVGICIESRT